MSESPHTPTPGNCAKQLERAFVFDTPSRTPLRNVSRVFQNHTPLPNGSTDLSNCASPIYYLLQKASTRLEAYKKSAALCTPNTSKARMEHLFQSELLPIIKRLEEFSAKLEPEEAASARASSCESCPRAQQELNEVRGDLMNLMDLTRQLLDEKQTYDSVVAALREQVEELEVANQSLKMISQEKCALEEIVFRLEEENGQLKAEKFKVDREQETLANQLSALENENTIIRLRLDDVAHRVGQMDDLQRSLSDTSTNLAGEKSAREKREEELHALVEELTDIRKQVGDNEALEAENKTLLEQLSQLRAEYEELRRDKCDQDEHVDRLQRSVQVLQAEREDLVGDKEKLATDLKKLQERVQSMQDQMSFASPEQIKYFGEPRGDQAPKQSFLDDLTQTIAEKLSPRTMGESPGGGSVACTPDQLSYQGALISPISIPSGRSIRSLHSVDGSSNHRLSVPQLSVSISSPLPVIPKLMLNAPRFRDAETCTDPLPSSDGLGHDSSIIAVLERKILDSERNLQDLREKHESQVANCRCGTMSTFSPSRAKPSSLPFTSLEEHFSLVTLSVKHAVSQSGIARGYEVWVLDTKSLYREALQAHKPIHEWYPWLESEMRSRLN